MSVFGHKKSLGQNFLTNKAIVIDIVEGAHISDEDVVIEIGPGQGALTAELANQAKKVIAVEIDDRLIPELKKRFAFSDNVEIVHGDVLNMNIQEIIEENGGTYKLVANIPYYITAPIIRVFLEAKIQPKEMVLMVQKEVAERLCAEPGGLSVLGVSAQYYAKVSYLFTVDKSEFDPVPAVDSAVVNMTTYSCNIDKKQSQKFFRVVKIGFSAKRKTLCNNIANGLHRSKDDVKKILESCDISPNARAQELGIDAWKKLAKSLED